MDVKSDENRDRIEGKMVVEKAKETLSYVVLLMLWNNITSLHTAVKTISSSILAGMGETRNSTLINI